MKNNKPPYLLGLLCIIPLLGAIIGIALVLYGIFRYKDKKLIIIGFFGIISTIIVYYAVFYNIRYGKSADDQFAKISEIQLKSLVKIIEFYKLQNGDYPDSLEQIKANDKTVSINDPLLLRKMDNALNTKFEYKKIRENYTLFSVGIDGKINTADDIYPNISNKDSTKLGFIKLALP